MSNEWPRSTSIERTGGEAGTNGQLIALHEHTVFVHGALEATSALHDSNDSAAGEDTSTAALTGVCRSGRETLRVPELTVSRL